jgi:hypothetical protein
MKWLLLFFVSLGIIYYANGANMDETNLNELIKNIPDKWDLLEVKSKDSDEVWFFRKNIGAKTIKVNKSLQTLIYLTVKYKPKDNSKNRKKCDMYSCCKCNEKWSKRSSILRF